MVFCELSMGTTPPFEIEGGPGVPWSDAGRAGRARRESVTAAFTIGILAGLGEMGLGAGHNRFGFALLQAAGDGGCRGACGHRHGRTGYGGVNLPMAEPPFQSVRERCGTKRCE
jgi:hypothetical protein